MKRFDSYKTSRIKVFSMGIVLLTTILFTGCSIDHKDSKQVETDKSITQVYYVDTNETKIVGEDYNPVGTTPEELVEEYLKALSEDPSDISLKKAKPDSLVVEKYDFNEAGRLSIYFNSDYNNLSGISEVLCRATIVKTLCQIEGVDSIEFYVSEQPLKGFNEKPVGLMVSEDFIDNTNAEDVFVTVYYSNKKGTALVGSNLKITYDGNFSIEQLIIERLISGPIEENMIKTLPEGTELIKVSTKDGICYVDFNEKLLDQMTDIKDEVIIYSVVNSLVELSTINKVQFTIDGATRKNYRDGITFDGFFERNLELVEGSK